MPHSRCPEDRSTSSIFLSTTNSRANPANTCAWSSEMMIRFCLQIPFLVCSLVMASLRFRKEVPPSSKWRLCVPACYCAYKPSKSIVCVEPMPKNEVNRPDSVIQQQFIHPIVLQKKKQKKSFVFLKHLAQLCGSEMSEHVFFFVFCNFFCVWISL